ncbi:siderophore-interacting protein [Paenibacillus sp. 1P07SE]|uniref:siderophore-interacting protein n=1 Tax=Paenibacillus sp. 1P07SE TaxID=3132209 RepID=UPI0039A74EE7
MSKKSSSDRRLSRNPLDLFFAKYKSEGIVTEAERIEGNMRRIRIRSEELDQLSYQPGQHVRIQIRDPLSLYGILRPSETLRTYTIWDYTVPACSFELRIHLYDGDGIGLNWARHVSPGDHVTFWGPMGDFVIQPAPYYVFAAEETGSVATGAMIRSLAPSEIVYGALEFASERDEMPIPGAEHLQRVYRNGDSPVSSRKLLTAIEKLDLPALPGAAYVAGEAQTCGLIMLHLIRERGWPRNAVKVKPFWTPGKRGLH